MVHTEQAPIDRPMCPKGHGPMEILNQWEVKGKAKWKNQQKKPTGFRATIWYCPNPDCSITFRTSTPLRGGKK